MYSLKDLNVSSVIQQKMRFKNIFSAEFVFWSIHLCYSSVSQMETLQALQPAIVIKKLGRDGREHCSELGKTATQSDLSYA